ncbi:hypothetical protein [Sphaerisporangium album]|uniref:hypothetical protein n=1 Tax=Sphaerisporangium album TaxID=509200 RepID=UPI0015EFE844|nr:hypothetical protein [Sphaerisporangium album]
MTATARARTARRIADQLDDARELDQIRGALDVVDEIADTEQGRLLRLILANLRKLARP